MKKIEPLQSSLIVTGFGDREIARMKSVDIHDTVKKVNELIEIINEQQEEIYRLNLLNMANHNTAIKFSNPAEHPAVARMADELHRNYNNYKGVIL